MTGTTATRRRKRIFLHGDLARFGGPFDCEASNAAEAISALANQIDGFAAALRHGHYQLWAGGRATGRPITGPGLHMRLRPYHLHIAPAIAGQGKGEGKMLLGLTLLGLSFVPGVQAGITSGFASFGEAVGGATGGELAGIFGSRLLGGAGSWLLLNGASDALSPQIHKPAGQADSASIGVGQPIGEGAAIPLVYGRVRVQDAPIIASGIDVEVTNL
jgi:predicted phage tail protein